MRILLLAVLLLLAQEGCGPRSGGRAPLTPEEATAVQSSLRAFAHTVAQDVTQEGPSTWRRHFADDPAFFMAVEGRLAFPNSATATTGINILTHTIKHVELNWGDDLRVDPFTPRSRRPGHFVA